MLLDLRPLLDMVSSVLTGGDSNTTTNARPRNRHSSNDLAAVMFEEDEELALVLGALS